MNGGAGSASSPRRRRGAVVALVAAMLVAAAVGVGLGWERSPAASSPTGGQGGPILAGPATSLATTLPPTTGPTQATVTDESPIASLTLNWGGQQAP